MGFNWEVGKAVSADGWEGGRNNTTDIWESLREIVFYIYLHWHVTLISVFV